MVRIFNENELEELSLILINDGVISVPTDTVYGLCCSINSLSSYNKLIELKERPKEKSFPLMCSDITQIKMVAEVNPIALKIIEKFMPGAITIILKKKESLPSFITNDKDTVAIRLATSNSLKELIELVGCPLFMTSANISGFKPCTNITEILKTFPTLDGILDGDTSFGVPSTIVDCSSSDIKLLREGPISLDEINIALK